MAFPRIGLGFPVLLAVLLAGCSGTSEPNRVEAINLSGSVGDGPAVGAEITVTDADGEVIEQQTSDAEASYQISLPEGLALPVRITAAGGTDLVTGRELDFTLVGAALEDGEITVNLTPLGTLAVLAAECSADGLTGESLDRAWQQVFGQLSMGLDRSLVPDPIGDPVDAATVEAVVLANEAVGETVRRTVRALAATGTELDGDAILAQVACELAGRPQTPEGATLDPRLLTIFKGAELGVRLETLARRLEVDDLPAMTAMDDSIRSIMPELADPSVASVPVTADGRDQTLALLGVFLETLASDELAELAVALDGAPTSDVSARVQAALTPAVQTDLRAYTDNLAFADESELAVLIERRERRDSAPAPMLSFAAERTSVAAGESTRLSWASSDAEVCVASGGWDGGVALEGVRSTGSLERSTVFELACAGLGGTTRRAVVVMVDGVPVPEPEPLPEPDPLPEPEPVPQPDPLPEPDPVPEPLPEPDPVPEPDPLPEPDPVPEPDPDPVPVPTVSLQAADLVVADGTATQLSWSSSNADSCSASGGWSGARETSGSASSGALNRQTTFSLSCSGAGGTGVAMISVAVNGAVTLAWQAPTENVDGTPLTDLGGYRIYYGDTSRSYTESVEVTEPGADSYALTLSSGQYYFAMTAVDADGNESAYSNEVVKVVD